MYISRTHLKHFQLKCNLLERWLSPRLWPGDQQKIFRPTRRNVFLIKTRHFLLGPWKGFASAKFTCVLSSWAHFLHFVMSLCRPKCNSCKLWSGQMVNRQGKMSEAADTLELSQVSDWLCHFLANACHLGICSNTDLIVSLDFHPLVEPLWHTCWRYWLSPSHPAIALNLNRQIKNSAWHSNRLSPGQVTVCQLESWRGGLSEAHRTVLVDPDYL